MDNKREKLEQRYHASEMWQDYDKSGIIRDKVNHVRDYIPDDVESILDIGCGNGIITNELAEHYHICGVDISAEALKQVKAETLQASADSIPVRDRSWDMVFSSEMLEHLPDDVLERTIHEITRITRKYVFITVPNRELLEARWIRCPKCGNTFHIYGHLHSFTPEAISRKIGPEFRLIRQGVHGPISRDFQPFLLKIKQNIANQWKDPEGLVLCPSCGNTDFNEQKGNPVSRACNLLNRYLGKKKPFWLFLLYERKG